MRTIETGERFMACLAWGRQTVGGALTSNEVKDSQEGAPRKVNVIASGCWDYVRHFISYQSAKVMFISSGADCQDLEALAETD